MGIFRVSPAFIIEVSSMVQTSDKKEERVLTMRLKDDLIFQDVWSPHLLWCLSMFQLFNHQFQFIYLSFLVVDDFFFHLSALGWPELMRLATWCFSDQSECFTMFSVSSNFIAFFAMFSINLSLFDLALLLNFLESYNDHVFQMFCWIYQSSF